MERYTMKTPQRSTANTQRQCVRAFLSAAIVVLLSLTPATLFAQTNADCSSVTGSWCLRISEKEKQLVHFDEPEWMKPLMWDLGITRNDYYRNMPTLELSNIAASGSPAITQFTMTIGDSRFHFGDSFLGVAALMGESTLDQYDLTSSVSPDGNKLTVNITEKGGTGGLAAGDLIRFRVDIDVDPGFTNPPFYQFPDFRTVFFDKNGEQVYGPDPAVPPGGEDNSQIGVLLSDGTILLETLPDYTVTGFQNQYFNGTYHPRGVMEGVDIFPSGGGTVIPEPAGAMLALLGLCGGLSVVRRKRS